MKPVQLLAVLTRVSIGWYFLYAGVSKVVDPSWSAAGYLNNAQTFEAFYGWLASPAMLPITNAVNQWGLTLIGLCLIIGLGTKWAARAGAVLMALYWLPILDLPYAGDHAVLIDDHVIYAMVLLMLSAMSKELPWSADAHLLHSEETKKHPWLKKLL